MEKIIKKLELKRKACLFWGLGLDESADVLPVPVAKLLDGVQQPHLLARVPLLAPIDAVPVGVPSSVRKKNDCSF